MNARELKHNDLLDFFVDPPVTLFVRPPVARCAVCGEHCDGRSGFPCETCGVWFRGRCHWQRLASAWERAVFDLTAKAGGDPWMPMVCKGCRS